MKGKWTTLKLLLYFSLLRLADLAFPPATSDEKTKDQNGHSNDPWLTACTFVMRVPLRFLFEDFGVEVPSPPPPSSLDSVLWLVKLKMCISGTNLVWKHSSFTE